MIGYDEKTQYYRAMIDCQDGSSYDILTPEFVDGVSAEAFGRVEAARRNGGLPVKDGPGCMPPLILC